jgi:ubiquinone/menaquinone biosynthesis C-methylase UbiE
MKTAAYDSIAEWYDTLLQTDSVVHTFVTSHLLDLTGDVKGKHVCDLACGQGHVARELARNGARVTGVDISVELMGRAQRYEASNAHGITYLIDDAQTLSKLSEAQFDGVTCNLALTDIPDLRGAVQSAWRILRRRGWFVFSITHPCFEAPHAEWQAAPNGDVYRTVHSYFVEGFWRSNNPHGVRGRVGAQHRTLSTYVNTLAEAGFTLQCIHEPQPRSDLASLLPAGYAIVPAFLLMRCVKDDAE